MSDRRIVTLDIPAQRVRVLVDTAGWDEAIGPADHAAAAYAAEAIGTPHAGLDCDPIEVAIAEVATAPSDTWGLP